MTLPYFDLSGRIAIVSGGASGIGLAISEAYAEAGATVVICSRRLEICVDMAASLTARTGAEVVGMRCDVTASDSIDKMLKELVAKYGGIDVLVNCAGVAGSEKPALKMEIDDWNSVIDINLTGAFKLTKAVGAGMVKRGKGGRVVNVASIGGAIGLPNMSAYCASKGGLVQMTKVLALEWARHDILVNAILPGYFETPMNTDFFTSDAGKKVISANVPMKRLGQCEEVKGLAILLASNYPSFMTGSEIFVDGGYTAK